MTQNYSIHDINKRIDAALEIEPIPVVAALMEVAELTWEEAYRAFMVEVAAWNYRVYVISHIHELQPAERKAFDGALTIRYRSSGISKMVYDVHLKSNASTEIVQYIDKVMNNPAWGKHS